MKPSNTPWNRPFRQWWGDDMVGLEIGEDGVSIRLTFPDPAKKRRREFIAKLCHSGFALGVAVTVIGGLILNELSKLLKL